MCNKTYTNINLKTKITFIKPKLTIRTKNYQKKLTFLYRQNALPLAYRYARHAKHMNMHTDIIYYKHHLFFSIYFTQHESCSRKVR